MLVGADVFLHAVHTFRSVWFRGRYGGGKTLLSFVVARSLAAEYGYTIYSNVAGVGVAEALPQHSAVIIYDEAHLTLGQGTSPKDVRRYLAFLRKRDYVLLCPSVMPLARGAYLVWCERSLNLGSIGLPCWVYHWGVAGQTARKSGGSFVLLYPQRYFGTYDTLAQPDDLSAMFEV